MAVAVAEGLTKRYGSLTAVDGLSFALDAGTAREGDARTVAVTDQTSGDAVIRQRLRLGDSTRN